MSIVVGLAEEYEQAADILEAPISSRYFYPRAAALLRRTAAQLRNKRPSTRKAKVRTVQGYVGKRRTKANAVTIKTDRLGE